MAFSCADEQRHMARGWARGHTTTVQRPRRQGAVVEPVQRPRQGARPVKAAGHQPADSWAHAVKVALELAILSPGLLERVHELRQLLRSTTTSHGHGHGHDQNGCRAREGRR